MSETRSVHDPFINRTFEVSNKLTDRLRGKYASGPTIANGEPEFGWRQFETPPIQHEAAERIEQLQLAIKNARDLIGAVNDQLPPAMKESNINLAWHILDNHL